MTTIEDLIRKKEEEEFVGRDAELAFFDDIIAIGSSSTKPILSFYGIGGIGKTSIIKKYKKLCSGSNIPFAMVDLRVQRSNSLDFIHEFRAQITSKSVYSNEYFSEFDENFSKILEIEKKLVAILHPTESTIKKATSNGVVSMASGGVGALLGSFYGPAGTVIGGGFGTAGGKAAMSTLGDKALSAFIGKGLSPEEAKLLANSNQILTSSFASAINKIAEEAGRVVLFFDTYEEIAPAIDEWVRDHFLPKLHTNVITVISGRDLLFDQDVGWHQLREVVFAKEIDKFTEDEAKLYLKKKGVEDNELTSLILEFTECLPWALALIFDMKLEGLDISIDLFKNYSVKHAVGKRVVSRFTRQIKDTPLSDIIDLCSVTRRFDKSIIEEIIDIKISTSLYDRLQQFSFVRLLNDGSLSLHDIVRKFLLEDLKATSYKKYKYYCDLLCIFYKNYCLLHKSIEIKKNYTIEYLYHALNKDEDYGITLFIELFKSLDIYKQYDFRDALLTEIIRFEFSKYENKCWREFCIAYQAMNRGDWEQTREILDKLSKQEISNWDLRGQILESLGDINTGQGRYSEAAKLYEIITVRQDSLKEHIGETYCKLCECYAILGQYNRGEQSAKKNLRLSEEQKDSVGKAWSLKSLGDIYRLWGKTALSIDNLQASLNIFTQKEHEVGIATALTQLGRVYTHSGEWLLAEKCLTDAKSKYEKLYVEYGRANTILFLANIFRFKRQWCEAQELYNDALLIHQKMDSKREIGPLLGSLGVVLMHQGKMKEAMDALMQSFEMKEDQEYLRGMGVTQIYLGDYYLLQNQPAQSLNSYQKALEFAEKSHSNFHRVESRIRIVETFRRLGKFEEIHEFAIKAANLAKYYKYPHQMAILKYTIGKLYVDLDNFSASCESFSECFNYAVRYNCFFLYQLFDDFISFIDNYSRLNQKRTKVYLLNHMTSALSKDSFLKLEFFRRNKDHIEKDSEFAHIMCKKKFLSI